MARGAFSTSNYFSTTTLPSLNEPITIAFWAYLASDNNDVNYINHINTSGSLNGYIIRFDLGLTNNPFRVYKGSSADANISSVANTSGWNFCAALYVSDTSRYAYCNGSLSSENTTNVSDVTLNQFLIGVRDNGTIGFPWGNGYIAEYIIWNTTISPTELDLIYNKKLSPEMVKPENIITYINFIDNREIDQYGGLSLTENGTVPVQPHPPINYNTTKKLGFPSSSISEFMKSIGNSLSLSGSILKKTLTNILDTLGLNNSTVASFLTFQSVSSSINFSSFILKKTLSNINNTINFSSSLIKKTIYNVINSLNLDSSIISSFLTFKLITDSINFTSSITRTTIKRIIDTINFTSMMTRKILKSLLDTINFNSLVGSSFLFMKSITNSLSFGSSINSLQKFYQIMKSSSSRYIMRLRRKWKK